MTGKDLFREVGNISEKYITEAEETKRSIIHNVAFRRGLGTAACLVLCVGIFAVTRMGEKSASTQSAENSPQCDAVASAPEEVQDYEGSMNEMATQNGNSQYEEEGSLEDLWNSLAGSDRAESSTNAEDSPQFNYPEEMVGEEPAMSDEGFEVYDYDEVVRWLELYPNDYEELLHTDAFVVAHGSIEAGWDNWQRFLSDAQAGEYSYISLVEFTEEGDAIITAVVYDGEIYHIVMDCTRDAWGTTGIVEYEYKYLYTDTYDGWTEVVLSDLELEGEEIREAILSDGTDIHSLVNYVME